MLPFRKIVSSFRRYSRVFAMLTAHLDESYNNRTFCVGGWLLPEGAWGAFSRDWQAAIERERQKSLKAGFPPIQRYHASDCSSLKNDFDPSKGWDSTRQIKLSKRLLGIIIKHKPYGIAFGGSVDVFLEHFPGDKKRWREALYYFAVSLSLMELNEIRKAYFPSETITGFYERGGKFSGMANRAFDSMKDDPRNADVSPHFFTMAPVGWEDCTPIQSADLLAFEGMRRMDGHLNGITAVRKSFAALLGNQTDLAVAILTSEYYQAIQERKLQEIAAMMESKDDKDEH